MRSSGFIFAGVVIVASACATGGNIGEGNDAGKDSGITAKDSGNTNDGSSPSDASTNKDTGTDTCQKAPPSDVCGVFPQCDCGPTATCEVNQTALDGTSSCVPAGTATIGQACTATANQCAPGLTCIWNECHPYCGTAGAQCTNPNTNACINLTDSNNAPIPNLLVCHIDCELADPNSCGGNGEGCIYFDVDQVDCYPVGTTTANCNATTSICPPGQVCLTDQTNYFCEQWCRINGNDCTSGTCTSLGTNAPTVNGQEYGYCQ
jgi:hypothetical protein